MVSCISDFQLWLEETYIDGLDLIVQINGAFGNVRDCFEIENIQIDKNDTSIMTGNKVVEVNGNIKEIFYDEIEEEYVLLYEGCEMSFSRV